VVVVGHSTGGEIQFILKNSSLRNRLKDFSMGWGTGAPAGMESMRKMWGRRTAESYRHVSEIRPRLASGYAGNYLGPLNPFWNPNESREVIAEQWMGREEQRRPQFKQTLQDMEHNAADNLREHVALQIRETLEGNRLGVDPDEVIADLFTTTRAPLTGYRRMIFTVAQLDGGHWNSNPAEAKELQAAIEFREKNPEAAIRVLVFDLPMTHYGHVEKPRQLAGGLLAALRWLFEF
jgi:hypothetical protein